MTGQKIFEAACELAPIELSDAMVKAMNGYDNSGMILAPADEVCKVLVTLDLTPQCAEYAAKNGYGLVVTHHPAIYRPIRSLTGGPLHYLATKGIGVISMHLNLDIAAEGIDWCLAKGLGAGAQEILIPVQDGLGYGRLFTVDKTDLVSLKQHICEVFGTDNVMIFGNRKKEITRIASFCGAGCNEQELALLGDADAVVSADFKHHVIRAALDMGKCVIQMTHYASENYGMKHFAKQLAAKLGKEVQTAFYGSAEY